MVGDYHWKFRLVKVKYSWKEMQIVRAIGTIGISSEWFENYDYYVSKLLNKLYIRWKCFIDGGLTLLALVYKNMEMHKVVQTIVGSNSWAAP